MNDVTVRLDLTQGRQNTITNVRRLDAGYLTDWWLVGHSHTFTYTAGNGEFTWVRDEIVQITLTA